MNPICFNFHIKKEFWRKVKPLQEVKEGLKSKFSKYSNSVKVVTSSGAQGNTHLDLSGSAISSQGAPGQQEQSIQGGLQRRQGSFIYFKSHCLKHAPRKDVQAK